MKIVYDFIDNEFESFFEELREFIRLPGISTENTGIEETVSWLTKKMRENGIENVKVFKTHRHPIILGKADGTSQRTLLVYGHYDVQPAGKRNEWEVDPFSGEVVDNRLVGRGTCDMKNNLMACVHAVKALFESRKELPINLVFVFEGEEEIGSPSLKPFIEQHRQDLLCDAILCADGSGEGKDGTVQLIHGLKGMVDVELFVRSPVGHEIHSGLAGMVENPAWRLIAALMSLKEDDKVLVPGFYDRVKKPTLTEKKKYGLAKVVMSRKNLEKTLDVKIKKDMSVSDALIEAFYKPTLNIDGICGGYTEPKKIRTIVPDKAWAKVDIRLVPGQEPHDIFQSLKTHLISKGFSDVEVEKLGSDLPAYRVDPNEEIVRITTAVTRKVVTNKTIAFPLSPGSGAMAWLPTILRKPMAFAGSGMSYMSHRPNEFITKEQYLKGIKLFATIFTDFASSSDQ